MKYYQLSRKYYTFQVDCRDPLSLTIYAFGALCWYSSMNLARSYHEPSSVTDRCPKVQSTADYKTRVCLGWLVGQHIHVIKKNWTQISGSRHRFGSGQREAAGMDGNNCSSEARVDRQWLSVPVVTQQMTRDTRSNYWLGFPLKYKGSGARTKEIKFHNSLSLAFEGLKNVRKSNAAHDDPVFKTINDSDNWFSSKKRISFPSIGDVGFRF